jgi:glycosyltransferase involved in cell wall biosynthesis
MEGRVDRILFIHEGKAAYPDIAAYKTYFQDRFRVEEASPETARSDAGLADSICWHMMGFYRTRIPAASVIHDYRSLSVGMGRRAKDWVKARFNHRPDLRIYQNESIKRALGINDDVPEIFLPMGVPDFILRYRQSEPRTGQRRSDFCYIGSMLPERRIDRMIDSFLARYGSAKVLSLYGQPSPDLVSRYQKNANVEFAGTLPQSELFSTLGSYSAAVCYFPNHYPHILQTPTKLLEYAALGMRIIANEQPQSRIAAEQYGIVCHWGPADDMFKNAPEQVDWADNASLDPEPMLWSSVIRASGVDAMLDRLRA